MWLLNDDVLCGNLYCRNFQEPSCRAAAARNDTFSTANSLFVGIVLQLTTMPSRDKRITVPWKHFKAHRVTQYNPLFENPLLIEQGLLAKSASWSKILMSYYQCCRTTLSHRYPATHLFQLIKSLFSFGESFNGARFPSLYFCRLSVSCAQSPPTLAQENYLEYNFCFFMIRIVSWTFIVWGHFPQM